MSVFLLRNQAPVGQARRSLSKREVLFCLWTSIDKAQVKLAVDEEVVINAVASSGGNNNVLVKVTRAARVTDDA